MNPAPPPPPPPLQPPQQNRPSSSCHRHPEENFTGFCPSCLFERLSVLDPSASNPPPSSSARKSSAAALKSIFFPELRRTKSFSASKNEAFSSAAFEPQRKSCDVRVRTTLCNNNNEPKITNKETSKASSSKVQESKEEEEEEEEEHKDKQHEDEIQVVDESNVSDEIVIEEEEVEVISVDEEREELKTMKDHIDLDSSSQPKKAKGSFWSAATVFSKKLQKWRQKQKEEKESKKLRRRNPVDKPTGRKFRETQSEVADYGFGRRSCDIDPRFSLDAGRISFDDPRYSLDEPRASWDGYLIGRTGNFLRMPPPPPTMLSVAEDDAPPPPPPPPPVNVVRTDTQIPVEEEPPDEENDDFVPGGSAQTKEYYSDSSRRRKSFDRSNSMKKMEMNELKRSVSISNSNSNSSSIVAKVTPASVDYTNGMKTGFQDRDNCFSGEMGASVIGDGDRKGEKKSRRWSIWGLIHRRGKNKDEDDDRYNRVNGLSGRLLRSNSSVSWRNGQGIGGGGNGNKGRDEFVLERNRSARYSSNDVDNNGLLRFYLTPLRGVRRNGSVKTSSKPNHTHSIARTVLGLY